MQSWTLDGRAEVIIVKVKTVGHSTSWYVKSIVVAVAVVATRYNVVVVVKNIVLAITRWHGHLHSCWTVHRRRYDWTHLANVTLNSW